MNCVLFAKMDQVFSYKKKNYTLLENGRKILEMGEKYWKNQGILSIWKCGNHDIITREYAESCLLLVRRCSL